MKKASYTWWDFLSKFLIFSFLHFFFSNVDFPTNIMAYWGRCSRRDDLHEENEEGGRRVRWMASHWNQIALNTPKWLIFTGASQPMHLYSFTHCCHRTRIWTSSASMSRLRQIPLLTLISQPFLICFLTQCGMITSLFRPVHVFRK